jgi:hypothetical protein
MGIAVAAAGAILLSALLVGVAARDTDAATRKVAIGVAIHNGMDLTALDSFRSSIGGRRVAIWTIWRGWDPGGRPFPMAALVGARERGATPVIWWEPYIAPGAPDPKWTRNLNITAGLYDDYIRGWARDAKAFGSTILLRFAHQANADYLPWAWDFSATDDNTVQTFIAAWRHVHRIFDEEGATNVKWVWSVATQTCAGDGKTVAFTVSNCMSRPLGYPGNAWVDYMAFTWENWATAPSGSVVGSGPWIPMIDGFKPVVDRLKRVSDKPIYAVAISSAPDGGNRANWIRNGYQAVHRDLPRVVAISWLHVDLSGPPTLHRDWRLTGTSLDAYAEIAAMTKFQGRID